MLRVALDTAKTHGKNIRDILLSSLCILQALIPRGKQKTWRSPLLEYQKGWTTLFAFIRRGLAPLHVLRGLHVRDALVVAPLGAGHARDATTTASHLVRSKELSRLWMRNVRSLALVGRGHFLGLGKVTARHNFCRGGGLFVFTFVVGGRGARLTAVVNRVHDLPVGTTIKEDEMMRVVILGEKGKSIISFGQNNDFDWRKSLASRVGLSFAGKHHQRFNLPTAYHSITNDTHSTTPTYQEVGYE
jgi:hypothetical protein